MSEKDYQTLMGLVDKLKKKYQNLTKEQAQYRLYRAGILDEKGNFTKPYKNLGKAVERFNSSQSAN